jgi:AmmeMemoRadiSam system protein A
VAIETARRLGASRGIVLSYANSGDTVLADRSRVVGYGAVAFVPGEGAADVAALEPPASAASPDAPLTPADRAELLRLARESIRRYVETGTAPLARPLSPVLRRAQGVFVTLKKQGELRGCIGHTAADTPLAQNVGAMALQAAFNDHRFPPLEPSELPRIEIEVSLLTPLVKIAGPEAIVLGRDGVVLRKSGRSALFLPEVAVEQGWTRDEMLGHLCAKAGLPEDAWRSGAEFLAFRTIAIYEKEPATPTR